MRAVNGKGEEKSGGVHATLAEEIQTMLDNCTAVKGEQFARLVSAQHALLQMPTAMGAVYMAGARNDVAQLAAMTETVTSLSIAVVLALAGAATDADMDEAFNLAQSFMQKQQAVAQGRPK